jgi:hypothetical protein
MRSIPVVFICLFFISCGTDNHMKGFNEEDWKTDHKGCSGKRLRLTMAILNNKAAWKGMDDDVLIDLLGKPEKSFYYERNAKAFSYFIEPGSQCEGSGLKTEGRKFTAEVNATGFVNLIRIEN